MKTIARALTFAAAGLPPVAPTAEVVDRSGLPIPGPDTQMSRHFPCHYGVLVQNHCHGRQNQQN